MAVIEVEGLNKHYPGFRGGTTAVASLDLSVPEGGVYGFLGPNGSGKTTTIRCLMNLVRPTKGLCRILGANSNRDLAGVIHRVGSIVETPAFFGRFSAQRNLELLARIQGIGKKQVREVLERVGLGDRTKDLVRDYSLGMKQRLGLAAALLKDPELLILDEPAHGLDPAGINEVRQLIRTLGDEGRTIFLSSHLLGEVQQICDSVAILSKGKAVAVGPVSEVLTEFRATELVLSVAPMGKAIEVLRAAEFDVRPEGKQIVVSGASGKGAEVTETLAKQGIYLSELRPQELTLEEVFLELTREPEGEAT